MVGLRRTGPSRALRACARPLAALNPGAAAARIKHTIGCATANLVIPSHNIRSNKLVQPVLLMLDSCKVMHHVGVTTMQQVDMMRMHKTKPILHMRVLNARLRRIDNSDLHPAPQLTGCYSL